ncbi:unnamed protein product [Lupinus luteus]|uniref:Uncharacterized protein n=1 Tax=Lupinus luteus TaxID=3873 RepID=A0AAV1VU24_LUPLU
MGLFRRAEWGYSCKACMLRSRLGPRQIQPVGKLRLTRTALTAHQSKAATCFWTENSTRYKFSMSEEGEWTLENDRCTYNGSCHLELELKSSGSTMRLPSHHTQLEPSFTLPSSRPPCKLTLSETSIPGIRVVGESSTRQTRCSDDLNYLPYVRAARRSFPNFDGDATNEPMSQDSANEEMEDDECDEEDCVELVDIVDSIEVINISSDKENEEDPSEGSSSVNGGGGN